ncbi:leucyl-cystinyl aminopeptidase-like [Amblyomma americanum]
MVHTDVDEGEISEEGTHSRLFLHQPTDDFQEKLIVFVALLTCVSLVGATVMGVVQILRLKARTSGLEALLDGANGTTNVSDWSNIADTSPWRPLHYDLLLHPNLENQTYEGYVHAVFRMQKNARKIELDSSRTLEIATTVLRWKSFPVRVTRILRQGDKLVVETTHLLRIGRTYNLTVQFRGRFHQRHGLVLKREGNEIALFMRPRDLEAHVSFPCFGDPGWKTTFDVRLLVSEHMQTSSTARLRNVSSHSNGTAVHTFHRTDPMSAYLLSVIVTNFSMVSSERLKLWSPLS